MSSEKDYGTCCIVVPIKVGVGLICMYTLATALLNIFALFTGDIRFQATGYDLRLYYLTPVIGAFGFVFGFVGLFGVYDDLPRWLRFFVYYLLLKLVMLVLASVADYRMLGECSSWLAGATVDSVRANPQLYVVASMGTCRVARWSYMFGALFDIAVNAYFWYVCYAYKKTLEEYPYKPISFHSMEDRDVTKHWKRFKVKDPRLNYFAPIHQEKTDAEKKAEAEAKAKAEAEAFRPGPGFLVGYGYGATAESRQAGPQPPDGEDWDDDAEGPPDSVNLANMVGAHQTADAM